MSKGKLEGMAVIYFLRHGQSEANLKGLFAGQREDSPLTAKGFEQAEAAAEGLKPLHIDRIISSPLRRTRQTAEEVAKVINFDLNKIEFDDRILEYDMGARTGTPNKEITSEEMVSAEGVEDPALFQERVVLFLREYKGSNQNILMVSHAGVGRIIENAKQDLNPRGFYDLAPYPNAQAIKLDLKWL